MLFRYVRSFFIVRLDCGNIFVAIIIPAPEIPATSGDIPKEADAAVAPIAKPVPTTPSSPDNTDLKESETIFIHIKCLKIVGKEKIS